MIRAMIPGNRFSRSQHELRGGLPRPLLAVAVCCAAVFSSGCGQEDYENVDEMQEEVEEMQEEVSLTTEEDDVAADSMEAADPTASGSTGALEADEEIDMERSGEPSVITEDDDRDDPDAGTPPGEEPDEPVEFRSP